MKHTTARPGLSAAATISKKKVNQDAFALVGDGESWPSGVVVADGLGSHFGAEIASAAAAEAIAAVLRAREAPDVRDVKAGFDAGAFAVQAGWRAARGTAPAGVEGHAAFGTTAICCLERTDELVLAYLGNGAIVHARGNFNAFPESQLLPWSAINLLNPHSVPHDGKNLLHGHFAGEPPARGAVPSVLRLSKDAETFGDIVIVATDGIASLDQTPMGRDDDGCVWVSGEPALGILYEYLDEFFQGPISAESLRETLERYLGHLDTKGLVQDDCTVGVLITEQALSYQRLRSTGAEDAANAPADRCGDEPVGVA